MENQAQNLQPSVQPKKKRLSFLKGFFIFNLFLLIIFSIIFFYNFKKEREYIEVYNQCSSACSENIGYSACECGQDFARPISGNIFRLYFGILAWESLILIIFSLVIYIKDKIKKIKSNRAKKYLKAGLALLFFTFAVWNILAFILKGF